MERINTRIKDEHALELGLTINKSKQYRISREQHEQLRSLREEEKQTEYKQYLDEQGIDESSVSAYWDKSDKFSILVRPNQPTSVSNDDFINDLIEKVSKYSPKYEKLPIIDKKIDNLLVIDIADAHFGKLSSSYETGESYNINIAKQRVLDGVNGIISKGRNFGIQRVLFIIGNDVLHYDNPKKTTTSGTPQDSDVMFFDMFNAAIDVHVEIIESLIQEFEVDILFCPSNHDYQSGWYFAKTLSAWFRNCDRVTIDDSIAHRKYYRFGKNLIGASHGDGAKMENMPLLMANEVPVLWSETVFRHVYLHHIHHKQRNHFQSGKDYIGVTVEYLRSPSASDSWHYRNGYVGAKKAIEGFIHNFNDGQVARLTHYFK